MQPALDGKGGKRPTERQSKISNHKRGDDHCCSLSTRLFLPPSVSPKRRSLGRLLLPRRAKALPNMRRRGLAYSLRNTRAQRLVRGFGEDAVELTVAQIVLPSECPLEMGFSPNEIFLDGHTPFKVPLGKTRPESQYFV